ncbi:MAG TPA: sensor histidine kinase [Virgibacillus sp.]|nr:sensor histidine kinase [Virgibacillus sp.]
MKLFLKDHALLVVVHCLQLLTIITVYWLDGYRNLGPGLYGVFLSLFLLTGYLVYRYLSQRKFYQFLSKPLESLEESLHKSGNTPLAMALDELLKSQYKQYQQTIQSITRNQENHRLYMDRWVHQMKTPLSVIEFTAESLDEPESSNIREETERMKFGLNTVLYMARLRTIEEDFQVKAVELVKVVQEVNKENKRFYIRNEVYPQVEESREGITVYTDEKWLYFILSQLINNGVKYSAGKSNRLIVSIDERDGAAVLEVTDFGIGIPQTDVNRVFSAFYTGESGRKYRESTGMGLYLVKEIANHLQYTIEIDTKVGSGTTFRIIFKSFAS